MTKDDDASSRQRSEFARRRALHMAQQVKDSSVRAWLENSLVAADLHTDPRVVEKLRTMILELLSAEEMATFIAATLRYQDAAAVEAFFRLFRIARKVGADA